MMRNMPTTLEMCLEGTVCATAYLTVKGQPRLLTAEADVYFFGPYWLAT